MPSVSTEDRLKMLPRWARIAFAVRCARRAQRYFGKQQHLISVPHEVLPRTAVDGFISIVDLAEQSATEASSKLPPEALTGFDRVLWALGGYGTGRISHRSANYAAHAAMSVGHAVLESAGNELTRVIQTCDAAQQAAYAAGTNFDKEMDHDLSLLKDAAEASDWGINTCVPPQFFSTHSRFKLDTSPAAQGLFTVAAAIDEKLIDWFCLHPESLYSVNSRLFEQIIAELFSKFGFDVELTQSTRDGGCDIVAIHHGLFKTKLLVECKHYRKDRKVGINFVRQLHGVVAHADVNKGVLVTTSDFTKPASDYIAQHEWILEGCNYDNLLNWLDLYQIYQMDTCAKQNGYLLLP